MTAKVRVYELAKELNIQNKDLVEYLQKTLQLSEVKSHSSSIPAEEAVKVRRYYEKQGQAKATPAKQESPDPQRTDAPAPPRVERAVKIYNPNAPKTAPKKDAPLPNPTLSPEKKSVPDTKSPDAKANEATASKAKDAPVLVPVDYTAKIRNLDNPSPRPTSSANKSQSPRSSTVSTYSPNQRPAQGGGRHALTPRGAEQRNSGNTGNAASSYRPNYAGNGQGPNQGRDAAPAKRPSLQPKAGTVKPVDQRTLRKDGDAPQQGQRPYQGGGQGGQNQGQGRGYQGGRPPLTPQGQSTQNRPYTPHRPATPPSGDQVNVVSADFIPDVTKEKERAKSFSPQAKGKSSVSKYINKSEVEKEKEKLSALLRPAKKSGKTSKAERRATAAAIEAENAIPPTHLVFDHTVTVHELATLLKQKDTEVIKYLFMKGIMVTINHTLDFDAMIDISKHFEVEAEVKKVQDMSEVEVANVLDRKSDADEDEFYVHRAPVISIMGHVDHGKTSLLDAIREIRTNIVDTEAGGITQRIGAYSVEKNGQKIVFLDTPGHEAFTAMRMRGAHATDIAILVVAADDGVMPQTIEAINHAKAAGIPIIVAINKIDKAGADPDRVMAALMEHGVMSEKYGGDVVTVEVSALQKLGVDDLLENILLLSELLELKANPHVPAEGVIIEAKLDKGKGPVASVLVQKGTLKVGQNILMGAVGGRVRALINDDGERIQEAGPSTPVEILGLEEVPVSGSTMFVIENHSEFKQRLSVAQTKERERRLSARTRNAGGLTTSLDDENKKELRIVLKADTHGSLEAAQGSLVKLDTAEVQVNIIHTGTGDLTEADVMLATASKAIIIAFNSREDANAARIAESEGVVVHRFDVIYHMVDRVEKLMLGELDADIIEVECGQAEIRQHFTIGKTVVVAGCMVTNGKIVRSGRIEVKRNGKVIHEGFIDLLKRFRDDVKDVAQGFECGITIAKFHDHQVGDVIVCYQQEERKRTSL
jgi:translation initiation factor IF-2